MSRNWAGCALLSRGLFGLIFIVSLLLAAQTRAAVVATLTPVADPPGSPFVGAEAALGSDWVSYKLSVSSTAGEFLQALDIRLYGAFHQKWIDNDLNGVPDQSLFGTSADGAGDTRYIAPSNAIVVSSVSFENNSGAGSPLADTPGAIDYGLGSAMRAAFGFSGPSTRTSADVAYVVLPRAEASQFKYSMEVANSEGDILGALHSDCPGSICTGPNIDVIGGFHDIPDGDSLPSLLDGSDFGAVAQGSQQRRTFSLVSTFPSSLQLGAPTFTGPFSLASGFPSRQPGEFVVQLNTAVPGDYTGSISFTTNDPTAPVFNFNFAARVVPEPASVLLGMFALVGLAWTRRRVIRI